MENPIDFPVDGTALYANKQDKNGNVDHPFEKFCKEKGIKQLLCITKAMPE